MIVVYFRNEGRTIKVKSYKTLDEANEAASAWKNTSKLYSVYVAASLKQGVQA